MATFKRILSLMGRVFSGLLFVAFVIGFFAIWIVQIYASSTVSHVFDMSDAALVKASARIDEE